jgi:DNA polymerase III subunit beta
MNLTIPRSLLLSMLDATARSVGQIGGSGMVLLSAEADSLAVTTADGTTEAQATSGRATITRDGRAMVDHRLLSQAVKSLPDGPVSLVMDGRGKGLVVNATGGARFKLLSADPDDFPPSMQARIEAGSVASSFTGPDFALTVGRTIYAVSRDDNRYGLNGIHMEATTDDDAGDMVRLVATDGSRLAWAEMEVATGAVSVQPRRLAPVAFLAAVAAVCRDAATVALSLGEHGLSATVEGEGMIVTLCSRWVEGEFPAYRSITEAIKTTSTVTVRRSDLVSSLRRVGIMATGQHRLVTVTTDATELRLSAAGDGGDAAEVVAATVDGPDGWRSGVNAAYLADALGQQASELVTLDLGAALDPIRMAGPRMLALIMPMRID